MKILNESNLKIQNLSWEMLRKQWGEGRCLRSKLFVMPRWEQLLENSNEQTQPNSVKDILKCILKHKLKKKY